MSVFIAIEGLSNQWRVPEKLPHHQPFVLVSGFVQVLVFFIVQ
jgi:hypothetical protein